MADLDANVAESTNLCGRVISSIECQSLARINREPATSLVLEAVLLTAGLTTLIVTVARADSLLWVNSSFSPRWTALLIGVPVLVIYALLKLGERAFFWLAPFSLVILIASFVDAYVRGHRVTSVLLGLAACALMAFGGGFWLGRRRRALG
jgi:hypothetical protein